MPKIIIELEDNEYKLFKDAKEKGYESRLILLDTITNGIPLDDIKAEIQQVVEEEADDDRWSRGLHYALVIIDKHTGKVGD